MYIHAKVMAKARKESLKETKQGYFSISVKEKAENNMANVRVVELLAEHFGVPISKIRIINGHHSPSKLFSVEE